MKITCYFQLLFVLKIISAKLKYHGTFPAFLSSSLYAGVRSTCKIILITQNDDKMLLVKSIVISMPTRRKERRGTR